MKKLYLITLCILFHTLAACSPFDSLDEMKERQDEARVASQLAFNDTRQGATASARALAIKCMHESDCAKTLSHKGFVAAKYFWAMEFQFWKNFMDDRVARRLELLESGAKVFFQDMKDFIENGDLETIDPTKISVNRMAALFSFAAQMHEVNISQKKAAGRAGGGDPWSILDIIMAGLLARDEINNGALKEEFKHVVVYNEKLALYMLKLRYNYLAILSAIKIGNLDKGSTLKIKMRLISIITKSYTGGTWSPDLRELNSEELKNWNTWMARAIESRDFLRSIGEKAPLHWKVKKVFKTMKLPADGNSEFTDTEKARYIEFMKLRNELIKGW